MEYYTTIAQVIPVLVLAMVFEVRVMDRVRGVSTSWGASLRRVNLTIALVAALLGEVACLMALRTDSDNSWTFLLATLGVAAPLVMTFL